MATMTISSIPYSLEALAFGRRRSIASTTGGRSFLIIPDVVISEEHTDEAIVTQHPVDIGAPVSDHAYVKPAVVHVQFAWSDNSRLVNSAISTLTGGLRGLLTTKEIYTELQAILNSREPVSLSTGKRNYSTMLLTSLKTTSTVETENCLICDMTFQEIMLAVEQVVDMSVATQASPATTSSTQDFGTRGLTNDGSIVIDSGLPLKEVV